jgi:DNA-binding NarL/FixJ family response regulator
MASVLIIDDHEGTLQTYSTVLRLSRFDAATAATGKAGIELAQRRAFDVHLVDRRLPDMDGIDVLRELKLNHVTGRIVVVTAFPTLESSFDAAQVGADGYVDGPLFGEEIVEVVTQAMTGPYPVHLPTEIRSRNQVTDQKRSAEPASAIDPRVREAMRMIDADLAKPWSVPNSRAASI